jgi:hypothetical protein
MTDEPTRRVGQCDFPCSSYSTFGMTTYCQACVGGYVTSQDNGKGTCSNPVGP